MKKRASYLIVALVSCITTATGWYALGDSDRAKVTPYADFERDLAADKVDSVDIDGTTYRYRVRGDASSHKTTGPRATLTSIVAMRAKVICAP